MHLFFWVETDGVQKQVYEVKNIVKFMLGKSSAIAKFIEGE